MNLRLYLRFLRPLRSLAFVAFYTVFAKKMGKQLFGFDHDTAWFIALAVALPFLLGLFIAWAAHEPMHRPFALILPNLRRRQRKLAALSALIAALAVTCAANWAVPIISPVATFGLACGLIALPCIDRYQLMGGGSFVGLAAFLVWLLICVTLGEILALVMNASPWLFLIAGLAICAASLARGFSRESLRARADIVFIAPQTLFSLSFFQRGTMARWRAERIAQKNRQKKSPATLGRDWTMRTVCTTTRDWMKVLWHANFGARGWSGSFVGVQLQMTALALVFFFLFIGIDVLSHRRELWSLLAHLADASPDIPKKTGPLFMLLQPGLAGLCAMLVLHPQLPYPISRERMARVVFWHAARQWATALIVPVVFIFSISMLGQTLSGEFLPAYGMPSLLAVDLPLAVLLPLLVAAGTLRRPVLRILAALPICIVLIAVIVTRPLWQDQVLSLPGVVIMLVAAAASLWLLWHRLRRHYVNSDMVLETSFVHPFAVGTFGSR